MKSISPISADDRSLSELPVPFGPSIATIGNFDGVHCGHRWVIAEVVARARALKIVSVAITFDPHPARVSALKRASRSSPLCSEKLDLLAATGLDAILVLRSP